MCACACHDIVHETLWNFHASINNKENFSVLMLFLYIQPLQDPKDVQAKVESDDVMKGLAMDKMIADLHGARVFKDFIINNKRGALMPKFLKYVNVSGSGRSQSQSAKRWTQSSS